MSNSNRINTATEQNKEDTALIEFRLKLVEDAIKEVGGKFDRLDNMKRSELKEDLKEFQDTIVTRFLDMSSNLQKQIDTKANATDLKDFKKVVYSLIAFAQSIVLLVLGYLITRG